MSRLTQCLADHRFADLFRDELGWDQAAGTMTVDVDHVCLSFRAIAQKRGLQVFQCAAHRRVLCNRGLLRRAQRQVARTIHEHILIYASDEPRKQVWQWSIQRPDGRGLLHREHPFFSDRPPRPFVKRLGRLRFSLDEEEGATLVDALRRVRVALDADPDQRLFARRPAYATRSDELAVAMAAGDPGAFDKFIALHRPLARHFSKRLGRWFGMDPDDAEQIATIGLILAARRFKPERGFQFSTYATWWMRHTCERFGPDFALPIRVPLNVFWNCFPLRNRLERLAAEHGPARARQELLDERVDDQAFQARWERFGRAMDVRSLSDPRGPERQEALRLPDPASLPIDGQLIRDHAEIVRAAIERLPQRHRLYVRLYYGIDGPPHTLQQIGELEGVTRERIRQVLVRAKERLHRLLPKELAGRTPVVAPTSAADASAAPIAALRAAPSSIGT